jgi:CPA2 family monovalent cation:H+ antiporter-2
MHEFAIIKDIVLILLVSIPVIIIFNRIQLPSIVGFLIAGMILGPYGFQIITSIDEIEIMAEIGIILLLFSIGLELSLKELLSIKKILIIGGGLQVLLTIVFSTAIIYLIGLSVKEAVFLGMLISLSSTAIVLKVLADKGELDSPHGRISLGILIFQDLAVVPLFLFVDLLGTPAQIGLPEVILRMLTAFGAVAVILIVAKYLTPPLLYRLAKLRMKEIFTVGIILIILGTAYLTFSLGLSFALGAFIAGLIFSESEYSYQIVADILPLRDAFNSIFFVSVGLLLNVAFVLEYPLYVIFSAIGVLVLKALIIISIVMLLKYPARVAVLAGIGLAQIGEFSFILAEQGMSLNIISSDYSNIFISSTIITMILTPSLIRLAPKLADQSAKIELVKKRGKRGEPLVNHVIIAGFGLNGRNLAHVLKETGTKYIVIEMNPDTVKDETARGENIIFGDISKEEILLNAHIKTAKIMVIAISDPASSRRALKLAKELNPNIRVIVRTRFMRETDDLIKIGAHIVIPEEFETSIQIFRKVLEQYHIPLNVIMQQVNLLRGESYKYLRSDDSSTKDFDNIDEILSARLTDTFYIRSDSVYAGKSIGEINLRQKTDATIIAIVREGTTISTPSAEDIIKPNDTVVITGTHQAVDKAFELLSGKE